MSLSIDELLNWKSGIGVSSSVVSSEYQSVLDYATSQGYTIPSLAVRNAQNQLITDLKSYGIWTLLDVFYFPFGDGDVNFAKINWKNPSTFQLTAQGSPVYTQNKGFTGAASSYLKTGWIAGTNGVNYTLNSASRFIYIFDSATTSQDDGGSGRGFLSANNSGRIFQGRINDLTTEGIYSENSIGLSSMVRTSSTGKLLYKNGVLYTTLSRTSVSLDTFEDYILCQNLNGTATSQSLKTFSCYGLGSGSINQANLYSAIATCFMVIKSDYVCFGDSYMNGSNASPFANSFQGLLAAHYNQPYLNKAVGGRGVWLSASLSNDNSSTNNPVFTPLNLSSTLMMAGLNDIRRNGSNSKTLNKIEHCHRVVALNAFKKSQEASGSSACTRSGTWAGFTAVTYGGKFTTGTLPGRFACSTSTDTDFITYTFTDTNVGVILIGNSGDVETYCQSVKIYIDGNLQTTIDLNVYGDNVSDGSYDNRRSPAAFWYSGLSNASHTIKVENNGGGLMPVDCFLIMNTPVDCRPVVFSEIPYLDATGYAIVPSSGSTGASDAGSARISSVVSEFLALSFPIYYYPSNTYSPTSDLDTDHIHRANTGHLNYYNGLLNYITR